MYAINPNINPDILVSTLREEYFRPEKLKKDYLRWLRRTGPKTIRETFEYYRPQYRNKEIAIMLNFVISKGFVIYCR